MQLGEATMVIDDGRDMTVDTSGPRSVVQGWQGTGRITGKKGRKESPRRPGIESAEEQKRRYPQSCTGLVVGDSMLPVFCYLVKAETPVERLRRPNSLQLRLATASPHAPWLFRWT
jgi:hypothetical protein